MPTFTAQPLQPVALLLLATESLNKLLSIVILILQNPDEDKALHIVTMPISATTIIYKSLNKPPVVSTGNITLEVLHT